MWRRLRSLSARPDNCMFKFIACEMAMHILGLKKEDLIDDVKEVIGVPTFLKYSEDAQVLFI